MTTRVDQRIGRDAIERDSALRKELNDLEARVTGCSAGASESETLERSQIAFTRSLADEPPLQLVETLVSGSTLMRRSPNGSVCGQFIRPLPRTAQR